MMEDPSAVPQQLAAWLAIVMDVRTSVGERNAAQSFLDAFKESPDFGAVKYVPDLIQLRSDSEEGHWLRFYGLSVLEHAVKFGWAQFDDVTRNEIRHLLLDTIAQRTLPIADEQRYIKEKLVAVLVEVAKHDWPQRWHDLFQILLDLASRGDTQAELVTLFFRAMSDTVGELSLLQRREGTAQLTAARCKQLYDGFTGALGVLLPSMHGWLMAQAAAFNETKAAFDNSLEWTARYTANHYLLKALAAACSSFAEWVPIKMLGDIGLVGAVIPLIRHPEIRDESLSFVVALLSRKMMAEALVILSLFDHLGDLFGVLADVPGAEVLGPMKEHEFRLRLVEQLVELGDVQLRAYRRKSYAPSGAADLHGNFGAYIDNMLQVTEFPSIKLQAIVLPFWLSLLRSNIVTQQVAGEEPQPLIVSLLNIVVKVASGPNPWRADSPMADIARIDFHSDDEASKFNNRHQKQALSLMRAIARADGHASFSYSAQFVEHIFSLIGEAASNPGWSLERNSQEYALFDAAANILQATVLSLPPICFRVSALAPSAYAFIDPQMGVVHEAPDAQTAELNAKAEGARQRTVAAMESLVERSLAFRAAVSDPRTLEKLLSLFTAFPTFLKHFPAQTERVFLVCFELLSYRQPAEAGVDAASLSRASSDLRSKAARTLTALALHVGESLVSIVTTVWEQVFALIDQSEAVGSVRAELYKLVLVILSKSKDHDQQQRLVAELLRPIVAQWASPAFLEAIASPPNFAASIGLLGPPVNEENLFSDDQLSFRESVFGLVDLVHVVVKWSSGWRSHALDPHFPELLGPLCTLIATQHALTSAELISRVPEDYHAVFGVLEDADFQSIAATHERRERGLDLSTQLRLLQWWLARLRADSYDALGSLTHVEAFFLTPNLGEMMTNSVFSYLDSTPVHYLNSMLALVIGPLRRSCPMERQAEYVEPLLPPLISFLHVRLSREWDEYQQRQQGSTGASEGEEVLRDAALTQLTITYARLLRSMSWRLPKDESAGVIGSDGRPHVLMLGEMAPLFIQTCISLIRWPVPSVSSIGVSLCSRILPLFINVQDFHAIIGEQMFTAALDALTHADEDAESRRTLELLRDIYIKLTPFRPDLTRGVLLAIPGIAQEDVELFEGQVAAAGSARQQRELLQALLARLVGSNIRNALFKREINPVEAINDGAGPEGDEMGEGGGGGFRPDGYQDELVLSGVEALLLE